MEDSGSCCSRRVETDPARRRHQKLDIYDDVLRRLRNCEEAGFPGFGDELWAHFTRLPTRYMMDVNLEKAEEVLLHKCLLQEAEDSANGLVFHVNLLQVIMARDSRGHGVRSCSTTLSGGRVHPAPAFGSSSNIEAHDSAIDNDHFPRCIHEITFAGCNKPKLLCQLTCLLTELGLNIQEAHAFNTNDGYALNVFVVDGWPAEESERLRRLIQTEVCKLAKKVSPKSLSFLPMIRDDPKLDHVRIPTDGNDEWEVDVKLLQFGEKLESASSGDMYKGTYCDQDVTIKLLNQENISTERRREFAQEVYIMRKVRHKNIVQFMGMCTRAPNTCIVTEFMSKGSLHDFLHKKNGAFKLPLLLKVALDVSKGMNYLHQCNIIHRDLKTANLLMNENEVVKVADFGVARVHSQSGIMTSETGTYRWMAPEVIEHRPYGKKADIFSFGIVLWELLTGKLPYEHLTPLQVALGVLQKGLRPSIPEGTHPKLAALIERCWDQDPSLRPEFSEILDILKIIAKKVGNEKMGGGFLASILRSY